MKPQDDLAPIDLAALALAMLRDRCAAPEAPAPRGDHRALLDLLRADPPPGDARLFGVAAHFALTDAELLSMALCLAVERDPATARLVAAAQDPVGSSRPLAGLLANTFGDGDALALAGGAAMRVGLLVLGDEPTPLVERGVSIPLPVAAALVGRTLYPAGVRPMVGAVMALPPSLERAVIAAARRVRAEGGAVMAIRSASDGEAVALAACVAATFGKVCVDLGEAPVADHAGWLAVADGLPVLRRRLGPADRWTIPPIGDHGDLVLLLPGPDGAIDAPGRVVEWHAPIPDEAERARLWRAAGLTRAAATRAARTYRQGAGRIGEIAARLDGAATSVDWPALVAAVEASPTGLDQLARRSLARVDRAALVMPAMLGDALDRLVERIGLRNRLSDRLGPAVRARYRPGVRALFTGDSGTGKTLAAHWLAHQTGLPLYRVDLAAMTSKWIGETEKNLSVVLDAAQHADVLLFFDEADALFGARTDVSDAHDRYANAQTNYLLQRIEDFDGVAVLATNSRDRFDPAFVRRLDAILEFPLPDAAARRALWCGHLGDDHGIGERELDALSVAIDLAGGHIRNIALGAEARALARGETLALADIAAATAAEYAKLGRQPPVLPGC